MSTLLFDKPTFVMLPLTIASVFQRLTLKLLLLNASLHFMSYSLVPRLSHSSGLSHQHIANHVAHHLANSATTSTTNAKRKGDSTDPWRILTLTLGSSDNSEYSLTFVLAPSRRCMTDLTKTSGIHFSLILALSLVLCRKLSLGSQSTHTTYFH